MKRIQRQRTKGWRMPPNTVYVGRPTKWGNNYRPGQTVPIPGIYRPDGSGDEVEITLTTGMAVVMYRAFMEQVAEMHPAYLNPLRGKDLACWCPLDQPCHADVLLELASSSHVAALIEEGTGR